MKDTNVIALSPQRPNIYYSRRPPINLDELTTYLADSLREERSYFLKTILFCRTYKDCGDLYTTIKYKLGKDFTDPSGYPELDEFRLVELYTRVSRPEKREEVIKSFINPSSKLCLIIATTAFGMGIDCPNIRRIIHWGLPSMHP